jgi:transcriptional regulator with XRE-family HTH domain
LFVIIVYQIYVANFRKSKFLRQKIKTISATMLQIGEIIKKIRELAGLNQAEFAETYGVLGRKGKASADIVSAIERGVTPPEEDLLRKISKSCGIDVQRLKSDDFSIDEVGIVTLPSAASKERPQTVGEAKLTVEDWKELLAANRELAASNRIAMEAQKIAMQSHRDITITNERLSRKLSTESDLPESHLAELPIPEEFRELLIFEIAEHKPQSIEEVDSLWNKVVSVYLQRKQDASAGNQKKGNNSNKSQD